MKAAFYSG